MGPPSHQTSSSPFPPLASPLSSSPPFFPPVSPPLSSNASPLLSTTPPLRSPVKFFNAMASDLSTSTRLSSFSSLSSPTAPFSSPSPPLFSFSPSCSTYAASPIVPTPVGPPSAPRRRGNTGGGGRGSAAQERLPGATGTASGSGTATQEGLPHQFIPISPEICLRVLNILILVYVIFDVAEVFGGVDNNYAGAVDSVGGSFSFFSPPLFRRILTSLQTSKWTQQEDEEHFSRRFNLFFERPSKLVMNLFLRLFYDNLGFSISTSVIMISILSCIYPTYLYFLHLFTILRFCYLYLYGGLGDFILLEQALLISIHMTILSFLIKYKTFHIYNYPTFWNDFASSPTSIPLLNTERLRSGSASWLALGGLRWVWDAVVGCGRKLVLKGGKIELIQKNKDYRVDKDYDKVMYQCIKEEPLEAPLFEEFGSRTSIGSFVLKSESQVFKYTLESIGKTGGKKEDWKFPKKRQKMIDNIEGGQEEEEGGEAGLRGMSFDGDDYFSGNNRSYASPPQHAVSVRREQRVVPAPPPVDVLLLLRRTSGLLLAAFFLIRCIHKLNDDFVFSSGSCIKHMAVVSYSKLISNIFPLLFNYIFNPIFLSMVLPALPFISIVYDFFLFLLLAIFSGGTDPFIISFALPDLLLMTFSLPSVVSSRYIFLLVSLYMCVRPEFFVNGIFLFLPLLCIVFLLEIVFLSPPTLVVVVGLTLASTYVAGCVLSSISFSTCFITSSFSSPSAFEDDELSHNGTRDCRAVDTATAGWGQDRGGASETGIADFGVSSALRGISELRNRRGGVGGTYSAANSKPLSSLPSSSTCNGKTEKDNWKLYLRRWLSGFNLWNHIVGWSAGRGGPVVLCDTRLLVYGQGRAEAALEWYYHKLLLLSTKPWKSKLYRGSDVGGGVIPRDFGTNVETTTGTSGVYDPKKHRGSFSGISGGIYRKPLSPGLNTRGIEITAAGVRGGPRENRTVARVGAMEPCNTTSIGGSITNNNDYASPLFNICYNRSNGNQPSSFPVFSPLSSFQPVSELSTAACTTPVGSPLSPLTPSYNSLDAPKPPSTPPPSSSTAQVFYPANPFPPETSPGEGYLVAASSSHFGDTLSNPLPVSPTSAPMDRFVVPAGGGCTQDVLTALAPPMTTPVWSPHILQNGHSSRRHSAYATCGVHAEVNRVENWRPEERRRKSEWSGSDVIMGRVGEVITASGSRAANVWDSSPQLIKPHRNDEQEEESKEQLESEYQLSTQYTYDSHSLKNTYIYLFMYLSIIYILSFAALPYFGLRTVSTLTSLTNWNNQNHWIRNSEIDYVQVFYTDIPAIRTFQPDASWEYSNSSRSALRRSGLETSLLFANPHLFSKLAPTGDLNKEWRSFWLPTSELKRFLDGRSKSTLIVRVPRGSATAVEVLVTQSESEGGGVMLFHEGQESEDGLTHWTKVPSDHPLHVVEDRFNRIVTNEESVVLRTIVESVQRYSTADVAQAVCRIG